MARPHIGSGLALAAALALGFVVPAHGSPAPGPRPADPAKLAERRLHGDADGALRIQRSGGRVRFVGARHGTDVANPAVHASQSPVAAARAHLDRYGAALGADAPGMTLVAPTAGATSAGASVVRLQQDVGGIPVVAGQAAVTMYADRSLSSIQADLSSASTVAAPIVGRGRAREVARASMGKTAHVTDSGRWLLDPAVIGMPSSRGARGVWRFVVTAASGASSDVMVDDVTGRVLLTVPLEESIDDRVVCDRANATYDPNSAEPLCESGYARAEGDPATSNVDVDSAYDLAGETAQFYQSLGVDLPNLIGRTTTADPGGPKRLESTVRFCYIGYACPYANAFWNGKGMYYGQGWATADDVVGHEMTHGVTEHTSNLFYWGQSGAINESLSDIMGEIVDHRFGPGGEDNSAWLLGEDSPIGALRSMKDPTLYNQPDSMTSANWYQGTSDAGGVHTNSGVGNKTAYLISQGNDTFTGIDAGDPSLAKSAYLWLNVDERLISGSDYSDLAVVLDQTCSDLIGTQGFTSADCGSVHQATVATALAMAAPGVPATPGAVCPSGGIRRDLYDGSTVSGGHGYSPAVLPTLWHAPSNTSATGPSSALDYWVADDVPTTQVSTLVADAPVHLPAGQASYLQFRHRFDLDFYYSSGTFHYYDGGTVAIDDVSDGADPVTLTSGWINGPARALQSPYGGVSAFSGDSGGWWTSRADISSYAGQQVEPQFTLRTDSSYGADGWAVADIVVYTCDTVATNVVAPTISGTAKVGQALRAVPGTWTPGVTFDYQWRRDGADIVGATGSTYRPVAADVRTRLTVAVTAAESGILSDTAVGGPTANVARGTLTAVVPKLSGVPKVGRTLTASAGAWKPSGITFTYRWLRDGKGIAGHGRSHRLVAADRGHHLQVVVTGALAGYVSAARKSARTVVIR